MQCYEDQETSLRLQRKIERYAIDVSSQAKGFEAAWREAQDRIDQLPPEEQSMLEYDIAEIDRCWDTEIECTNKFPVVVLGMALFADNARADKTVWPTHIDASLAVRAGVDMSKRSKLVINVFDRHYKVIDGELKPHRNWVEAEVNGKDLTIALGRLTKEGYMNKWGIKTCLSGSRKHEAALKKLGYKDSDRDRKNKPIGYFLDLFKQAEAMVANENHPKWRN